MTGDDDHDGSAGLAEEDREADEPGSRSRAPEHGARGSEHAGREPEQGARGSEHGARAPDRAARATPEERWEAAAREALLALFEHHLDAVTLEVEDAAVAVEGGFAVDATHVGRLRRAVADLETTVEACLARLAEGTEPWEESARRVPDWRLREELGLDPEGAGPAGKADAVGGDGQNEA